MIQNLILPEKDELNISWQNRLALCNGYTNVCQFLGRYVDKKLGQSIQIVDDRIPFPLFYKNLRLEIPMYSLFDSVSLIRSYASVYNPIKTLRILMETFYRIYDYSFMANSNNRAYEIIAPKICPICWKEKQIIYKSHNLQGVKVCKTHGVPLLMYEMKKRTYNRTGTSLFNLESYSAITVSNIENELDYAKYAAKFAESKFDFTKGDLYQFLSAKHDFYERHPSRFWNEGFSFETLIGFLMTNYPDITDFARVMKEYTTFPPDESFYRKEGFTLMSPSLNNYVQLSCQKCGSDIITTSWAIKSGFGCPCCDSGKEHRELAEIIVSKYSNGKYKLVSYESAKNITLKHCCGATKTTTLSNFLSHLKLCKNCEARFVIGKSYSKRHKVQFDETKFELVGSKSGYMKIWRCKKCGRVFQYTPSMLRKRNACPICAKEQKMHESMDSQCSGKFEILRYPTIEDESVKLKCLNCGYKFEDIYRNKCLRKLTGEKLSREKYYICPACHEIYSITASQVKDLIKKYYKPGQEFSITDIKKREEIGHSNTYIVNSKLHYLVKLGVLRNTSIGRFILVESQKDDKCEENPKKQKEN